jgi:hypothetical protein
MVGDFFPKSDNYFAVGAGEGLGDNCSGGLLFLAFNSGEGFLLVRLADFNIEAVSPGEVLFGGVLPGLDGTSGGAGGTSGGGEIPDILRAYSGGLGDCSGWFVGMGVSGLWAQFTNFGSKLSNLLLKLGDSVGTGVLGGSKCSLHAVEAGEDLVHDVGVGLAEHHGAEGILGEGGVGAFAWSRGASREYGLSVLLGAGGACTGKESHLGGVRRS